MVIVYKNRLLIEPGVWNGVLYPEKVLKNMKLPETLPLTQDFKPNKIIGEVRNIRWDNVRKGIIGNLVFKRVIPYRGYGAMLTSKELFEKPRRIKECELVGVASVKRPLSSKYMLRIRKRRKR